MPLSGYYEWRTEGKGPKQPYHFSRADGQAMTFAGLWEAWKPSVGLPLEPSPSIVGSANDQARPYHERMPAILNANDWERWLDL